MNDRELLELAAKAAGMPHPKWNTVHDYIMVGLGGNTKEWNPLIYDADAFRLAVKLNLIVGAYGSYTSVFQTSAPTPSEEVVCWHGSDNLDPYAATRRAIVRAAAEIGRGME